MTRHTIGLVFVALASGLYFAYQVVAHDWAATKHSFLIAVAAFVIFALWGYSDEAHERHDERLSDIEKRLDLLELKTEKIEEG